MILPTILLLFNSARCQLPINTFPEKPITTLEQVLDEDWLPSIK